MRHVEIMVAVVGLQGAKGVKTLGEVNKTTEVDETATMLNKFDSTRFRALSARASFLSSYCVDIQYSVKDLCREVSQQSQGAWSNFKRMTTYQIHTPRAVWTFGCQEEENQEVFSDSQWAGCGSTARSTSGGVIVRGSHCLKRWSNTQKMITLSSAQAKHHGSSERSSRRAEEDRRRVR